MHRKKTGILVLCILLAALSLAACGADSAHGAAPDATGDGAGEAEDIMEKSLHLYIDDKEIAVAWEQNESVDALIELAAESPLTVSMSMYGGFEQVGSLGTSLPSNDKQTRTSAGDIVLYSGSQIVIFYGSNSWAYTKLGKVSGKTDSEMTDLLGKDNVTVTISCE